MLFLIAKPDSSLVNCDLILSVILKPQKSTNGSSSLEFHMQAKSRTFEIQQKDADIFTKASLIASLETDAAASRSIYKLCSFSLGFKQAIDDLTDVYISIKIFDPSVSSQNLIEMRNTFQSNRPCVNKLIPQANDSIPFFVQKLDLADLNLLLSTIFIKDFLVNCSGFE